MGSIHFCWRMVLPIITGKFRHMTSLINASFAITLQHRQVPNLTSILCSGCGSLQRSWRPSWRNWCQLKLYLITSHGMCPIKFLTFFTLASHDLTLFELYQCHGCWTFTHCVTWDCVTCPLTLNKTFVMIYVYDLIPLGSFFLTPKRGHRVMLLEELLVNCL